MTLTGIKFIIREAENKQYQKKVKKIVKDQNGKEVEKEELVDKQKNQNSISY